MKTFSIGCTGALLGLLAGIAVMIGTNFFLQSPAPSADLSVPTVSPIKSDVTIVVSANYFNAQLKQAITKSGVIKQPNVALASPNIVKLTGLVDVTLSGQRISTNATITLRATVQSGRVALTVDKIEAGGINVPQSLIAPTIESVRKQAEDQINALVQNALKGTGLKLANLRVTANDLTIELTGQ